MNDEIVERRSLAVLVGACALVFVPLAGCYGLWDPWETHYAEIARQILVKNDWISLWWPCSPVDRLEVFHKPVLHFWLMALSMKALLVSATSDPARMIDGWRVEWAVRLPNILLSIAAIASVWRFVRAAAGARAAWLTAAILATSAQWALVTRQAMTDLPFVAPMTIALALAGRALMTDDAPADPRSRRAFFALFGIVVVPQLVVFSVQLHLSVHVGSTVIRTIGLVPMLPYIAGFLLALRLCARVATRRQLLLLSAYVWCGLATLAKGPAGLALPGLAIVLWLVCAGRARDAYRRLELPRGLLVFVVVAFPWYHAMLIRHGLPFWNELIGDNYVNRASGRHGDRGGWDYYVTWAAYGLFPWTGAIAAAVIATARRIAEKRRALATYAVVWIVVDYVVLTLVKTKFHHYILCALPAVAILGALALEELPYVSHRARSAALVLIGVPLTLLIGRDLAALPARVMWLFDYDYVNMPGIGRPWPSPAVYGTRHEYGHALLLLAGCAAIAVIAVAARRCWRLWPMCAVALACTLFFVDRMLIALSPHWSQKQVIAAYYTQRRDAGEALLVWCLYWRGENFYTQNEIWSRERTVFLPQSQPAEKLHEWLRSHPHRRAFFLVERNKLESLRGALPPELRPTLRITDESNNKLYLAVADIP